MSNGLPLAAEAIDAENAAAAAGDLSGKIIKKSPEIIINKISFLQKISVYQTDGRRVFLVTIKNMFRVL